MLNHTQCCRPTQNWKTAIRRRFDLIGWLLPAAGLTLLPKCPVCLAAWIALLTGLGISISAAASLRAFLIVGYVAVQFYFMYRISRHLYRTLHRHPQ